MDLQVNVCKHMRWGKRVTIKLKGLNQRFEESDGGGDRQVGFVIITIRLSTTDTYVGGLRITGHREWLQ